MPTTIAAHRNTPEAPEPTRVQTNEMARLRLAQTLLDGLAPLTLQRMLYASLLRPVPGPGADAERTALAQALVHLRRTGKDPYRVHDHVTHAAREALTLSPPDIRHALAGALPAHTSVCILGERHTGAVIRVIIGKDCGDPYAAPWYVVAVNALRACRAHGADEIEPITPALGIQ